MAVKLRVFDSLFVPLAKWSMLLTGNYRCVTPQEPRSIRDAVHSDLARSRAVYEHVDALARRLGADPQDQVPFEKYAKAAESENRVTSDLGIRNYLILLGRPVWRGQTRCLLRLSLSRLVENVPILTHEKMSPFLLVVN